MLAALEAAFLCITQPQSAQLDFTQAITIMASIDQDSGNPDNAIERITANPAAHYEPFGWHHWPQSPWFSYQFRRGLGETQ